MTVFGGSLKAFLFNLLFFAIFLSLKLFIGDAQAFSSMFFDSSPNKHVVYEYRFDANRPDLEGKFILIRKYLRSK